MFFGKRVMNSRWYNWTRWFAKATDIARCLSNKSVCQNIFELMKCIITNNEKKIEENALACAVANIQYAKFVTFLLFFIFVLLFLSFCLIFSIRVSIKMAFIQPQSFRWNIMKWFCLCFQTLMLSYHYESYKCRKLNA